MARLGVTTVEAKSGYGLDLENEIRLLEVYESLQSAQPVRLVSTLLAAHVVPREYAGRREQYVDLVCRQIIPSVARRTLARKRPCPVDLKALSADRTANVAIAL